MAPGTSPAMNNNSRRAPQRRTAPYLQVCGAMAPEGGSGGITGRHDDAVHAADAEAVVTEVAFRLCDLGPRGLVLGPCVGQLARVLHLRQPVPHGQRAIAEREFRRHREAHRVLLPLAQLEARLCEQCVAHRRLSEGQRRRRRRARRRRHGLFARDGSHDRASKREELEGHPNNRAERAAGLEHA